MPNQNQLIISSTSIRQDKEGRYCLNDLHKVAGNESKHQPAFFTRRKETSELVEELRASANLQTPIATLNDGANNGTYAVKELVYAYAMWVSPKFNLQVIRAYDALVTNHLKPITGAISLEEMEAREKYHHDALNELKTVSVIIPADQYLQIKENLDRKITETLLYATFTNHDGIENHHSRWTEADKQQLLTYRDQGLGYKEIAKNMGRTHRAIRGAVAKFKEV